MKQVTHEKNDYPKQVINHVVENVEAKHQIVSHSNNLPMDVLEQSFATNEEKSHLLLLPYKGKKGDFGIRVDKEKIKCTATK